MSQTFCYAAFWAGLVITCVVLLVQAVRNRKDSPVIKTKPIRVYVKVDGEWVEYKRVD